ncbi:MAG: hypothetical protein ABIP94_17425 [Planctomycetota bacterium]
MRSTLTGLLILLTSAAVPAQYAFHFEFDQAGVLPTATPGVGIANPTSTPTTTFFATTCGVLQQRTILDPTLGAFFYSGTIAGYPTIGPVMPQLATFGEARFSVLGGTGGPGSVPDSTGVLYIYPGVLIALIVNLVTGDVGLTTSSSILWTTPPGGSVIRHTYRLESHIVGTSTYGELHIDGALVLGPALAAPSTNNGWIFGDAAGSSSVSTSIDWDYVSIGQAPPGIGQANSQQAALFLNRSNTTHTGQMGLKGPFNSTTPGGSTITLEWNGPPNMPFYLFAGGQFPTFANFGCGGLVDLLFPVTLIFDPFAPFIGSLFFLDNCGYSKQTFVVPPLPPSAPLMNIQGLIFQPSGCPFVITAAHYVQA